MKAPLSRDLRAPPTSVRASRNDGAPMRLRAFFLVLLFALPISEALACTFCRSPTARLVRDSVLRRDPGANLAAIAAPLPLLAGLIALAGRERRRGGPR